MKQREKFPGSFEVRDIAIRPWRKLSHGLLRESICVLFLLFILSACRGKDYHIIVRGGLVYDGSGKPSIAADLGIRADTIAFIGDLSNATSESIIDAKGLAVAPGFINMLSWANESLLIDGNSQSDIRQGVTLEVMGEGSSMGPLNAGMKRDALKDARHAGYNYPITWTSLDEYLTFLETKGISPNVASFVGATTVRIHELGLDDRVPTKEEQLRMDNLVRAAMWDGALGVGASLIYAPASYASTEELISLCKAAAEFNGMYITHMRSEGNDVITALLETMRIAREAHVPAEIYHLKIAGDKNWKKLDKVIGLIDEANTAGLKISANMYTYPAAATGLDAAMPPWLQEGGTNEWIRRMKDPEKRKKALADMRDSSASWENLMQLAGSPDRVLLLGFANDSLKRFTGKTLAEVALLTGKSAEETAMDLVSSDSTSVGTVYFMMDESNIQKQLKLPFVSIGSDAASIAPNGIFLRSSVHPRAYGNFSRFLGRYVREAKVMSLAEAVRRLTSLPAGHLKIKKRGLLYPGFFADVVVFDPNTILDHATFEKPHQYSTGVHDVIVNGIRVLSNGEHTGAHPGRVVRGPGWKKVRK